MAKIESEFDWEDLSDSEWNQKFDDTIGAFNERRGEIQHPPSGSKILDGEYDRGILNKYVTEDLIRHYAEAIGDPNPFWRDPTYASGTRWGGIIAPPTFESAIAFGSSYGESLRVPGVIRLNGGNEHRYYVPIRHGDSFTIYDKYEGIEEKRVNDKPYRMFIEKVPRYYVNQREEVVAVGTMRSIYMATPPGKRGKGQATKMYQDKERRYFTEEELDVVRREYDNQLAGVNRRGAETRYWEDVVVGEDIPTVVKGPYDVCDAGARTMVSCYAYAFAIKWAAMRNHLQHHPLDPITGDYMFLRDWHYTDHAAQVRGYPFAVIAGAHNEMMLVHAVTDWMGDDGFVTLIDTQERRMSFYGDMTYIKGKVAKKFVEDGNYLVTLDVWAENQDGVVGSKGEFTIKLVAKAAFDKPI